MITSILLIGKEKAQIENEIKFIIEKYVIDPLDVTHIDLNTSGDEDKESIGIKTVRFLQKKLFYKPLRGTYKAVILEDADLLTVEAQNALLKTLEEPPLHTIILLTASSAEQLLQTVRSRCSIITIRTTYTISPEEKNRFRSEYIHMKTASIGEVLKKAEELAKDKQKALSWLETMILVIREDMLSDNASYDTAHVLRTLQESYMTIKSTNVNLRLAMEHCLVTL